MIPVIPGAHPVEPVRQVDNVSPIHEMSVDDPILDEKEEPKLIILH